MADIDTYEHHRIGTLLDSPVYRVHSERGEEIWLGEGGGYLLPTIIVPDRVAMYELVESLDWRHDVLTDAVYQTLVMQSDATPRLYDLDFASDETMDLLDTHRPEGVLANYLRSPGVNGNGWSWVINKANTAGYPYTSEDYPPHESIESWLIRQLGCIYANEVSISHIQEMFDPALAKSVSDVITTWRSVYHEKETYRA